MAVQKIVKNRLKNADVSKKMQKMQKMQKFDGRG